MSSDWVDNEIKVRHMLDSIIELKSNGMPHNPLLFVDLEGVNLSRHGCISIMQILVPPMSTVYLLDVHVLKDAAFNVEASDGTTLRQVLQSNEWTKVFYDVRHDSDALFSHFQINLVSVIDLQLMEFATRGGTSRFVNGLSRCIENDLQMDYKEAVRWQQIKNAGKKRFAPELGGQYEIFLERPLATVLVEYCVQDVSLMPNLLMLYGGKLRGRQRLAQSVHEETCQRIDLSKTPNFNGKGRHMAIGPTSLRFGCAKFSSPLQFPMSLACSDSLSKYCKIDIMKPKKEQDENIAKAMETLIIASTETPKIDTVVTISGDIVSN